MKKIITVFLAVLLLTAVLGTVAMAGLSKSDIVEITGAVDENGDPVEITVTDFLDSTGKVAAGVAYTGTGVRLTEKIAADVLTANVQEGNLPEEVEEIFEEELTVLWQKDITVSKLPVTLTLHADGTDGIMLYVFHYNGDGWEYITCGEGPDVEVTFDSLSPVGIVVRTADLEAAQCHFPWWILLIIVVVCGTAYGVYKKKKKDKSAKAA